MQAYTGDSRGSYDPAEAGRQQRAVEAQAGRNKAEQGSEQQRKMEAEARAQAQKEAADREKLNRARFGQRHEVDAASYAPDQAAARATALERALPTSPDRGRRDFAAPEAQSGMVETGMPEMKIESPLSSAAETAALKASIKPPEKPKGLWGRIFG